VTIKEFLGVIEGGGWHLDGYGCLSSDENDDCPLWYAYRHIDPDEEGDAEDYMDAGERIGLPPKAASVIAAAADNRGYPVIRKRLLEACGITN
jgi:hypothetical protein